MPLLRLLELLGLATYEIRGGEKAEVFIRINDPDKLERIASSGKYTNNVLQSIQEHHRSSEKLLAAFFTADMSLFSQHACFTAGAVPFTIIFSDYILSKRNCTEAIGWRTGEFTPGTTSGMTEN